MTAVALRLAANDNDPAIDREELVRDHLGFVKAIAARVKLELGVAYEIADLVAYGTQGLVEAASRFDPDVGVSFPAYAHRRIQGAILDGVRRMAYLPRTAHARRRAAHGLEAVRATAQRDVLPPPDEIAARRQLAGVILDELRALPARERRFLELHYFEDRTLADIGAEMGLSRSWSSRLHARALGILRRRIVHRLGEEVGSD